MRQSKDEILSKARAIIAIFTASKATLATLGTDRLDLKSFVELSAPFPIQPESLLSVLNGIDAITLHDEDLTISFADHLILPPLQTLKDTFRTNAARYDLPPQTMEGYLFNSYLLATYLHHFTKNLTILTQTIDEETGITRVTFPEVTDKEIQTTLDFFLA